MERINNASWCCDEIEELIKTYKNKYEQLRSIGDARLRIQAFIYYEVIKDLEKILYGESDYE